VAWTACGARGGPRSAGANGEGAANWVCTLPPLHNVPQRRPNLVPSRLAAVAAATVTQQLGSSKGGMPLQNRANHCQTRCFCACDITSGARPSRWEGRGLQPVDYIASDNIPSQSRPTWHQSIKKSNSRVSYHCGWGSSPLPHAVVHGRGGGNLEAPEKDLH
jgi:hypothetical protein